MIFYLFNSINRKKLIKKKFKKKKIKKKKNCLNERSQRFFYKG